MLRRVSSGGIAPAISVGGTSAADKTSDGKSAVDDSGWFSEAARHLLPDKPGTILHLVTGLGDERLCQRYAAGHVKPPAYFLRALLRSPHGAQWLAALMDGSNAPWWREHQRNLKLVAAAERFRADLSK